MRVTAGPATWRSHKKVLKRCKGFRNVRKNTVRRGYEGLTSALSHAYHDRRRKKGDFRSLWIIRINAAVRLVDRSYSYSRLMAGLKKAEVVINRKMLAELAVNNVPEFNRLVEVAMGKPVQPQPQA